MSRNIVLLFALIIIINSPTHSQKSAVKKQPKQGNKTTEIIAPVIVDESDKKVDEIKPYKRIAVTNYVPPKESVEAIINFFIHQAEESKKFEFGGEIKNESPVKIDVDTIIRYFKNALISLLDENSTKTLSFSDFELKGLYQQIHKKIIEEHKKPVNNTNKLAFFEIKREIEELWPSKEKVELLLELFSAWFENDSFYPDFEKAVSESEDVATLITEHYEKYMAYSTMGDFASNYFDELNALRLYYEGVAWLEKSNIGMDQKNEEFGKIFLKIAALFNKENDPDMTNRAAYYYNTAFNFFCKSENHAFWNRAWSYRFSTLSYLLNNFYPNQKDSLAKINDTISCCGINYSERQNLNEIKYWFDFYKEHYYYEPDVNYEGFYSIARTLIEKGQYKPALIYYLQALYYAIKDGSWGYIRYGIRNIAHTYYLSGNLEMFNEYKDLLKELLPFSNNDWQYGNTLTNISDLFYFEKRYDSCLHYLNLVQFDTLLYKNLFPPFYERLTSIILETKYIVLDSLHSDSARLYEQYHNYDKEYTHKRNENLLEIEGYGKQNWTWALQENEKNNLNIVIDSLKNEGSLLMGKIGKLNSGIALRQKQISDSSSKIKTLSNTVADLSMERNSLINNIQGLQKDTTALGVQIKIQREENESLSTQKGELKKWITRLSAIGLTIILLLIPTSIALIRRKKIIRILDKKILALEKETEEKDLGKKLTEQQLLNDTALGHDLISLIDHVPYMLGKSIKTAPEDMRISSGLSQCLEYTKNVREYFKENFKIKEKLVNTVAGEIELAKRYCELLSIQKGRDCVANITIENLAPELLKIEIPKHNLVNFIANAFLHGRANTAKNRIDILVRGKQLTNGYVIAISDNGGGFESLNIPDKEETRGLKLVFRQIANYNSMKNSGYIIHCDEASFQNLIQDGERTGTQITYKLIRK